MPSYLRVRLAHQWYGIDVNNVIEVLHFLLLNELPAARPGVLGFMRLREQVITTIDLRVRLGQPAAYALTTPIVTVTTGSEIIGLVVDEVDDLVHVDVRNILLQDARASGYVRSVARLPDSLLLVLDVTRLEAERETQA